MSRLAEVDLHDVAAFTIDRFGLEQARHYYAGLESCFETLAANPAMGRPDNDLGPGVRRFEHGSHVIFYTIEPRKILIVRVLHHRMDPRRHVS